MDLNFLVVVGTLVMLALGGGVVWFVILYQRRVIQSQIEIERINREKQQELLNASIQSEEQERMRIAAELHDDIAPTLASVKLYLSTAALKMTDTPLIAQSKALLDESLQKIRNIAHKLQPSTLYYLGLDVSLQALADMIGQSDSIHAAYAAHNKLPRLPENIELSLYRVVQELTHNILKHAHPQLLTIESTTVPGQVTLVVSHNGTGITQHLFEELIYKKGAIGLKNIVTRLKSIEASIYFEQVSVSLFTITIQAPIK
ncbi:sensor histidine kinase [Taibaiella koreensis]|uniref:sensor histidine kinase n=1 Tax=Taibaiella koreensis TaxID=1268548 RepID=UPI0013C33984|nr:histidine kinase [Taibaiella koreensis]